MPRPELFRKERQQGLGLTAGLHHRDVPIGIEPVSLQSKPRRKIRERAKAGRSEELAFQIGEASDFRTAEYREDELLYNGRDDHGICASEICQR